MREGDTIVVWRLDRLSRSMKELIGNRDFFGRINLKSLQENIDTTTSTGKLIFHMFGALAEFERNLIRERTRAGLASASARGRVGGRPARLGIEQITKLKKFYASKAVEVKLLQQLAKQMNIKAIVLNDEDKEDATLLKAMEATAGDTHVSEEEVMKALRS